MMIITTLPHPLCLGNLLFRCVVIRYFCSIKSAIKFKKNLSRQTLGFVQYFETKWFSKFITYTDNWLRFSSSSTNMSGLRRTTSSARRKLRSVSLRRISFENLSPGTYNSPNNRSNNNSPNDFANSTSSTGSRGRHRSSSALSNSTNSTVDSSRKSSSRRRSLSLNQISRRRSASTGSTNQLVLDHPKFFLRVQVSILCDCHSLVRMSR